MSDNATKSDLDPSFAQAQILSEALPFMRRFAGKTVVIKYGGHAMGDATLAERFSRDIVLLRQVGLNPIVVHGGGPQIGAMLEKLQIRSEFIDGLRVTDEETVDVVEMVLAGSINKQIVAGISAAGGYAVGICGKDSDLIRADRLKRTIRDPDSNIEKVLDLGLVGDPTQINPYVLEAFNKGGITPVIAPIGLGPDGETLNINADTVAGAIARAVGAVRLYMLTDVAGVLDGDGNLIPEMTMADAQGLIDDGTIVGGMIPKIETCMDVVKSGVDAATVIDGRVPNAILIELFTKGGVGTQIVRN
ncbi:MAG: acetylglutamate kinase [Magnetovibrio sp.]|nr:acetylglutamate kinase [Magnetovibrio sp.]